MKGNKEMNLRDFKISGTEYDRRRKLSEEDKKKIKISYNNGEPVLDIITRYGISRRMLFYVLRPETIKKHKNKERTDEDRRRDAEQHRRNRIYKKEIYNKIKIGILNAEGKNDG